MKRFGGEELRKRFLDFFEEKGHELVESSSLVPADPTSLFTSAGMQQFVPYLSGQSEPPYRRAASVQKCVRVNDIREVGDRTHHTFFEMLGNWSFGDYFKEKAVDFALEFLLEECGMEKERLWITIFEGEGKIPRDDRAEELWREEGFPGERIFEYGREENFWGPVTSVGPCGPCSEIFFEREKDPCGPDCNPNCECGRFTEVWNLVFMEYEKTKEGSFEKMSQRNVDTGLGFERLTALLQEAPSVYRTGLFSPIIEEIEGLAGKGYGEAEREFRVLADHARAASFIRAAGVLPSNTGRGHVLRRILRRFFRFAYRLGIEPGSYAPVFARVGEIYGRRYEEVRKKGAGILETVEEEEKKYRRALKRGKEEIEKLLRKKEEKVISGREAFDLYQTHGVSVEITSSLVEEKGGRVDREGYEEALVEHKKRSRKGAEKKFGGLGIENLEDPEKIEKATRLHTATHLLQAALREVLGEHVRQMGSDITPGRLRFDFSHPRPLTEKEIEEVEQWVNRRIGEHLPVRKEKMEYEEALDSGALAFFKARYPEEVFVYSVGGEPVSREVCAGPHVENTGELGRFEIEKEESAGADTRRIKGVLRNN